ncbi:hypothetical protein [Curtobacterium sp. NPDC089689]|uniref:hypothetical protein n=1 Tax=Curtobacterium sp. NPDC089689 TaxID=3363968 RepID=UPI003821F051
MGTARVAVIGGGRSGAAIAAAIERAGGSPVLLSPSRGFDVTRDDVESAIGDAIAVVEATGRFTTSRRRASAFFTASTKAVSDATNRTGARHVLLSIAQCTRPDVQGYGYFAGKTAQETLARSTSRHLRIVRSTQWFEFTEQNLERMRSGPIALVPGMLIQPVALDSVADVIAAAALDADHAPVDEVAGPDTTTLWSMTRRLGGHRPWPLPLPIPGRLGSAFRGGALLPGPDAVVQGPSFAEWLANRA